MKNSRNTIFALIMAMSACSISVAEEYLDTTETRGAAAEKSASHTQLWARDYFDANWKLFTGDSEYTVEEDSLTGISQKYFDANWALFERKDK